LFIQLFTDDPLINGGDGNHLSSSADGCSSRGYHFRMTLATYLAWNGINAI
jgi:hypothetical protein